MFEPGTVLANRWTLEARIDGGAMSDIFSARDVLLGDRAAVKVLQRRFATDEMVVKRFLREARVTQELRHPHVVAVRGHGLHEGLPFLAMELLEGESLEVRLGREPLHHDELIAVARQVGSALDAAHTLGVVHRDVKPDNLFVLAGTDSFTVKVLDFGFAKINDRFADDGLKTASNALLGSPLYMAPEQVRASREVTPPADLWSLAVVLYELATLRPPFAAKGTTELLVQVVSAPVPAPTSLRPGLPTALDGWCQRALHRDPMRRYPTGAALAEAFVEALKAPAGATLALEGEMTQRLVASSRWTKADTRRAVRGLIVAAFAFIAVLLILRSP